MQFPLKLSGLKIFLLSTLVALTCNVEAVLSIGALLTKGSKKVLLLGDVHTTREFSKNQDLVKLDCDQSLMLIPWIEKIGGLQEATMLLEAFKACPETINMKKLRQQAYIPLITLFPYIAQLHNYKQKSLSFVYGDIRSKTLFGVFEFVNAINKLNSSQVQELTNCKEYIIKEDMVLSTREFSVYVQQEVNKLKQEIKSEFIQPWLYKLEQEVERGKLLLSALTPDISVIQALYDLAIYSNAIVHDNTWPYFVWISFFNCLLASIGYMQELHVLLQQIDTVIVLLGRDHIVDLRSLLESQGFTAQESFGDFFLTRKFLKQPKRSIPLGYIKTEGLNIFLQQVERLLLSSQKASAKKNICTVCSKESINRCSICKKIYYCSQKCQIKDWPEHKKSCQTA